MLNLVDWTAWVLFSLISKVLKSKLTSYWETVNLSSFSLDESSFATISEVSFSPSLIIFKANSFEILVPLTFKVKITLSAFFSGVMMLVFGSKLTTPSILNEASRMLSLESVESKETFNG